MDKRTETLKPFKNLWPDYKSREEFEVDFKYTCLAPNETLPQIVTYY